MDILKEFSVQDIKILSDIYKKHRVEKPHVYSFFCKALELDVKSPNEKFIEIFGAQDGSWKNDGTFIAFLIPKTEDKYTIFLHTLDSCCKSLKNILSQTKIIDWNLKNMCFFALEDAFMEAVDVVLTKKLGMRKIINTITDTWRLKCENFQFKQSCPEGFYLKDLKPEDAIIINSHWPHRSKSSEYFIKSLIEINKAYGLFTKETDELVSWIVQTALGQLGFLGTREEFQGKGLARYLTNKLSEDIVSKGHDVVGMVVSNNEPSKRLFLKIGFEIIGVCGFIHYSKIR